MAGQKNRYSPVLSTNTNRKGAMNKVILIGYVGKNPECKTLQTGTEVASFSLATTEKWTSNGEKKEETSWHNVVFWGKQAELCQKYVFKGSKIMVEGRIKYEVYEKDGEKRYATKITGERLEFLSKKEHSTQSTGDDEYNQAPPYDDNDIPF